MSTEKLLTVCITIQHGAPGGRPITHLSGLKGCWVAATKAKQRQPRWCSLTMDRNILLCLPGPPAPSWRPVFKPICLRKVCRTRMLVLASAQLSLICEYSSVTKLYVGNLPFTATEDAVRALFSPHGTIESLALVNDRDSGQPRGFGFVEMSNADASRAIQALNGQDFGGRALRVNEAQAREARSGGGGGGARSGGNGGGARRY